LLFRGIDQNLAGIGNASEAVKKLKTTKIRLRKSLITNEGSLCFGAFCQFFHTFSVTAGKTDQERGSASRSNFATHGVAG